MDNISKWFMIILGLIIGYLGGQFSLTIDKNHALEKQLYECQTGVKSNER